MLQVVFVAATPDRAATLRDQFGLPDAPHATSIPSAAWLIEGAGAGSVVVVDAAAVWASAIVGSITDDRPVTVLVAVERELAHGLTDLLDAGADGFVALPAHETVIAMAMESARRSRARRTSQFAEAASVRRQLIRFAEDFRDGYQRERDRSRELAHSLKQLEASYRQTVLSLAAAVEAKDETTGKHIERVAELAIALAKLVDPAIVDEPFLAFGFLLHDLGKIGVPDVVLLKPGPLTDAEYEAMKLHAIIGERIVEGIEFLQPVRGVILHHHERWDGLGYPHGLAGAEIPKAARIFAVADAADAMLHDRPYRKAMSLDRVVEEFVRYAGTQFDPGVVEAFNRLVESSDRSIPVGGEPTDR